MPLFDESEYRDPLLMPSLSYLDQNGRLVMGAAFNYTMHRDYLVAGSCPSQELRFNNVKGIKPMQAWSLRITCGRRTKGDGAVPFILSGSRSDGGELRLFLSGFQARADARTIVRNCKTSSEAVELGFNEHMWVGDQYVI